MRKYDPYAGKKKKSIEIVPEKEENGRGNT